MPKMTKITKIQPQSDDLNDIQNFAKMVHEMAEGQVLENLLATERQADEIRKRQAKIGTMGLPELLDKRRVEYAIPDEMFTEQAAFDRIFVYQVRINNRNTASDQGKILLTDIGKQRELESAPFGIVLSAGLSAMDNLYSNGIGLGHIVGFIREAPWRKPMAVINGVEFYMMLLRAGDITGSLDTRKALRDGECSIVVREYTTDDGMSSQEHVFVDKNGKTWNPADPFIPIDQ